MVKKCLNHQTRKVIVIFLTSLKPGENSINIRYRRGREERKLVVEVEVVRTICASCWM